VSFHGSDGAHGFRGIARTASFARDDWDVDGAGGTPKDAVLTAGDAAGWRESWNPGGPVGPGAASLMRQDGWYYQLAEVPDVSLGCHASQTWDLGLFRSRGLGDRAWAQHPAGNPIVYSSRAPAGAGEPPLPCNVEYPGLFEDAATGTTYLMYGRLSRDPAYDGIYVYRLEWNRNLLANGDFWRADAQGWQAMAGTSTQLAVPRAPDGSPDGTPYLSFNCGAATCDGVQSVYQDVRVTDGLAGKTVAFGGVFAADGGTGALAATLFQLDSAGKVLEANGVEVSAGQGYGPARGQVKIDPRAARLRFQLTPRTPGGLRADDLYVIPQDGCTAPRYPAC
jgi:hypothetical protein